MKNYTARPIDNSTGLSRFTLFKITNIAKEDDKIFLQFASGTEKFDAKKFQIFDDIGVQVDVGKIEI